MDIFCSKIQATIVAGVKFLKRPSRICLLRGAELIDRRFAGWLFNPGFQFSWSVTVHISDLEAADTILSDLEHS
ncbi:hypothetical protein, partial [Ekhidna sp.]